MRKNYNIINPFTGGKYYLYRHVRNDIGQVFYIGVGTKEVNDFWMSYKSTYYRAFNKSSRSDFWKRVTNNTDYEVEILFESDDRDVILEKEKEFISLYGRVNDKMGGLVNHNYGGSLPVYNGVSCKNNHLAKNAKQVFLYGINGVFIKHFKSQKECAKYLNVTLANVSIPFRNKISMGDYIFSEKNLGEKSELTEFKIKKRQIALYKIEPYTNKVLCEYISYNDAAEKEGIKVSKIYSSVKKRQKTNGSYWIRKDEYEYIDNILFKTNNVGVVRISDEGVKKHYNSILDAALEMGVSGQGTIITAIRKKHKIKGYKWEYSKNKYEI